MQVELPHSVFFGVSSQKLLLRGAIGAGSNRVALAANGVSSAFAQIFRTAIDPPWQQGILVSPHSYGGARW